MNTSLLVALAALALAACELGPPLPLFEYDAGDGASTHPTETTVEESCRTYTGFFAPPDGRRVSKSEPTFVTGVYRCVAVAMSMEGVWGIAHLSRPSAWQLQALLSDLQALGGQRSTLETVIATADTSEPGALLEFWEAEAEVGGLNVVAEVLDQGEEYDVTIHGRAVEWLDRATCEEHSFR